MKKTPRSALCRYTLASLAIPAFLAPNAFAGAFSHTGAGPYEYTDTANWGGTLIGNNWTSNLTANQTITFATDYTTADNDGAGSGSFSTLSIANTGLLNHTFIGSGNRTLTLGGNITLGSTGNANTNKVTFGSTTDGQRLNIDLGGAGRTLTIGSNRTLELVNVLSGAGGITVTGSNATSIIKLQSDGNSYTGATALQTGAIVEVTKLANGGLDSSIGKSGATTNSLVFGGSAAATLRYVGAGDSTNRLFSVGGSGAMFDASGTGAINFTGTGALNLITSGTARTITFKGTNTDDNTMSPNFADAGAGKTSLLKQGAGRWILAGTNTYSGGTVIEAGTLATGTTGSFGTGNITVNTGAFLTAGNASSFGDAATLTFSSTSTAASITLSSGTDVIGAVYDSISATYMGAGTHDATALNNFFGTTVFSGLGSLTITAIPEPCTYAILAGASGLFLTAARRRRSA